MKLTRRKKRSQMTKAAKQVFMRECAASCPLVDGFLGHEFKLAYALLYGFEPHERIFAQKHYWESTVSEKLMNQRIMMLLLFAEVA